MTIWTVLGLGFLLGLRHATDADHVVAVSTIVSRSRTLRGAVLVGAWWGLGHTLTILLLGGAIVGFRLVVPPLLEATLEGAVAVMLIALGIVNLRGAWRPPPLPEQAVTAPPATAQTFSLRPLLIGLVHGLAGSAAIALLVLSTIPGVTEALVYLAVFGVGTIAGMALLTLVVAVPIAAASRRYGKLEQYLAAATGVASIAMGLLLAVSILSEHAS